MGVIAGIRFEVDPPEWSSTVHPINARGETKVVIISKA